MNLHVAFVNKSLFFTKIKFMNYIILNGVQIYKYLQFVTALINELY